MKVLSIRQPYAWLIAIGCKTIENRTWNRKIRGRFLIHASQAKPEKLDGWQESAMKKYCQEHGIVILLFGFIVLIIPEEQLAFDVSNRLIEQFSILQEPMILEIFSKCIRISLMILNIIQLYAADNG